MTLAVEYRVKEEIDYDKKSIFVVQYREHKKKTFMGFVLGNKLTEWEDLWYYYNNWGFGEDRVLFKTLEKANEALDKFLNKKVTPTEKIHREERIVYN